METINGSWGSHMEPTGSFYLNGTSNVTEDALNVSYQDYLETYLGVRYRGNFETATMTLVYSIMFVTGLTGNILTIIVIATNKPMHTSTSFYLLSLAISDAVTILCGLPPELYAIWEAYPWRFGQPYCLLKTFLTETTSTVSVLTIAAFTIERYLAICHPLKASQVASSPHRVIKVISLIWLAAGVVSIPFPAHARAYYYLNYPGSDRPLPDSYVCSIPPDWMPRMNAIFQLYSVLLFVVPMLAMVALYAAIGMALKSSNLVSDSLRLFRSRDHLQSRKTVLNVLVAVVVTFFVCWAPFHAQRLMTASIAEDEWTPTLLEIHHGLFYASGILYYVSSTLNPILYNLMSRKFRHAFQQTVCFYCASSRHQRDDRNGSVCTDPMFRGSSHTLIVRASLKGDCRRTLLHRASPGGGRGVELDERVVRHSMHDCSTVGCLLTVPTRYESFRMKKLLPSVAATDNGDKMAAESDDGDSDSLSSTPSTLAAYIRDEMDSIGSPKHHQATGQS